jgi:S1-C subfamily serine protease
MLIPSALSAAALALVVAALTGMVDFDEQREDTRPLTGNGGEQSGRMLPVDPAQTPDNGADGAPEGLTTDEYNNIRIYHNINPAVVNITSVSFEYNWFLEPVPQEGTGSGSIIDQDGHVLTNYHVVRDAEQLSITLADGTNFPGELVGADPENDLAVVKFDPEGKQLATVPLGSSENLQVGQKVLAIGNPFALDRTLTTGIVSGLGRPVRVQSGLVVREMIQTDASINPGNSGGPLLSSDGRMIGINTMIYSPSGGSVGIGFAVPVDTARRVVPDLIEYGKVRRGWIDIEPVQLFPALVRYADLEVEEGVLVSRVEPGSPADRAGLQGGDEEVRYGRNVIRLGGDIIVEVDGTEIAGLPDLLTALEATRPGETVTVKVIRDGRKKTLEVELSARPENSRLMS